MPRNAAQVIIEQYISLSALDDQAIWSSPSNGLFPLRSAREVVRAAKPNLFSSKYVWHKFLPNHIGVFMWRLLLHKLPIDEALWKKNIQLASKCACCIRPSIETFEHVFISNPLAAAVWNFCENTFNLYIQGTSIQQRCFAGWTTSFSVIYALLPSLALWHIWKNRNSAVFEVAPKSAHLIISAVHSNLHDILIADGFHGISICGVVSSYASHKKASIRAVSWVN